MVTGLSLHHERLPTLLMTTLTETMLFFIEHVIMTYESMSVSLRSPYPGWKVPEPHEPE